eukprot:6177366-Pleurochrysis_carterae.AAC.7
MRIIARSDECVRSRLTCFARVRSKAACRTSSRMPILRGRSSELHIREAGSNRLRNARRGRNV